MIDSDLYYTPRAFECYNDCWSTEDYRVRFIALFNVELGLLDDSLYPRFRITDDTIFIRISNKDSYFNTEHRCRLAVIESLTDLKSVRTIVKALVTQYNYEFRTSLTLNTSVYSEGTS